MKTDYITQNYSSIEAISPNLIKIDRLDTEILDSEGGNHPPILKPLKKLENDKILALMKSN